MTGGPERATRVRRAGALPAAVAVPAGAAVWMLAMLAGAGLADGAAAQAAEGGGQVPTPASVIGFEPGADHRLADYGQITDYFRALDRASDRLRLERIGTTVEGRPLFVAFVSSAANLERLDRWRRVSERLARAEGVSRDEAEELAAEGKAVVWIDGGMHSTEVATAQAMPVFAHRMVTSETAEARKIRERTVLMIMPVMNPDGLEVVVDWYREHRGTRFETSPLPRLYHEYVGHDNNRDWFMMLMPETRAVAEQLWSRWYPQIVYNHHQAGEPPPIFFVPPFADPVNPNIPSLVVGQVNAVGTAIARRFAEKGMPGVLSREVYTMWWNGGMRTAPYFHNQVGILTEGYHYRYATPKRYDPDSLPRRFPSGRAARRPSVFYPDPWKGGWWRLSDQIRYENTASMAVASYAADRKEEFLLDAWRLGRRSVEKGGEGRAPRAWVIPREQWNDDAARELVEVLRWNGAQVRRATSSFRAGGERYAAGAWIVRSDQAYRPVLLDLLEPQDYPDRREYPGGPIATPYDLAGWTLPMQMGVEVDRVEAAFEAPTAPVEGKQVAPRPGEASGSGGRWLIAPRRNASFRAVNRLFDEGASVSRALSAFDAGGRTWPAGTFVVEIGAERARALARETGLDLRAAGSVPAETTPVRRPRVGLYRSWDPSMDAGWTRWVLEEWGFPYGTVRDSTLRSGDLSRWDVIVLPHQEADEILRGHPPGTMPARYTGGVGVEGAARLKDWVEAGGTLVTLGEASEFATRILGLPVRNAVAGVPRDEFYIPGSLIRATVDAADPLAWGMQDTVAAYYVESLALEPVPPAAEPNSADGPKRGERHLDVPVRYAQDDLLMSGWERGAKAHLGGKAAVMRVPLGEGRVILTGFRAQFRGQPRGTFKLLFNALLAGGTETLPMGGPSGE